MINTLCNGLNPSQASLQLSLCVDTWDEFGPFTVDALDRAGRKKGTELLLQLGRGMAERMERRDVSGRDAHQPLPSAPSRSTGGPCVGADVRGALLCHAWHPRGQLHLPGTGLAPLSLPRGAAVPSSGRRGAARPHRRQEREGWGALPALSAGPDCEQLRADKERWRSAAGRHLLPLRSKPALPFPSALWQSQAAFWAGNLLCRRGKSWRVSDVRAGISVAHLSLLAQYCFISPCRGCCCFLSAPGQGG